MPIPRGQKGVQKVMREYKAGKLHSGKNGKTVKSRKQAVAIALSEAGMSDMRKKGGKITVPKRGKVTTKKRTMKQAEAQRRGMAATRAKQQKGRPTAAQMRTMTQQQKEREQDRRAGVSARKFKESY